MMSSDHRSLVIAMALAIVACGGDARWAGTITDSAGVTIVSNPEVGLWAAGTAWTFEEEVRIGAVDGPPEYQFGDLRTVTADSRGRIYALDRQAQHIQVYSPDGTYKRTIGGRGGGPGELQFAMYLLMGPGDTLLVPDGRNMRVNRYAPDGSSAGSFRLSFEGGRLLGFKASASGLMAQHSRSSEYFGSPATKTPMDVILLLACDGTVIDTMKTFPAGQMMFDGGARIYAPEPVWALTNDGQLIFGVNDRYRISFYADGHLQRVITKPFQRIAVGDREREAIFSILDQAYAGAGFSAEQRAAARSRIHFAESFPAFRSIAFGPMGTTWVQHVQPISEISDEELTGSRLAAYWAAMDRFAPTPTWDVFDSQGRFLGDVTLPPRFTAHVFRGDMIYGIWRDELDVQYVVRLHIVTNPRASAM